jgi:hypothetical protein
MKNIECTMNWIRMPSVIVGEWEHIDLNEHDCWYMVNTNRCKLETDDNVYNKKMKCNSNGCTLEDIPEHKFTYASTNRLYAYRCEYRHVSIVAENIISRLH